MNSSKISQSDKTGLLNLINWLDKDYYSAIEKLCLSGEHNANLLGELEFHQSATQYIILSKELIAKIRDFVRVRKEYFLPYIQELHKRNDDNHDCSSCTGKCLAGHNIKLAELKESITRTKDMSSRLQMMTLPLHPESLYPDVYRMLRKYMALLENTLNELIQVEESYLIPQVAEAQNNINAGN